MSDLHNDITLSRAEYRRMCDEIERLRDANAALLAACQAVVATIDGNDEIWSKDQKEYLLAEKAIAKATAVPGEDRL